MSGKEGLDLYNAEAMGVKRFRELVKRQWEEASSDKTPIQLIFRRDGEDKKIDLIRARESTDTTRAMVLESSELARVFGELPPITLEIQTDQLLIQVDYENMAPSQAEIEMSILNPSPQRPPLVVKNDGDVTSTSIPLSQNGHRDVVTLTSKGVPIADISYISMQFDESPEPVAQIVIARELFTPQERLFSQPPQTQG